MLQQVLSRHPDARSSAIEQVVVCVVEIDTRAASLEKNVGIPHDQATVCLPAPSRACVKRTKMNADPVKCESPNTKNLRPVYQ